MSSQQFHWHKGRQQGLVTTVHAYLREEEDPQLANIQRFSQFISEQKGKISDSLLKSVQNNMVELEQNFHQAPRKKIESMLEELQKNEEEHTHHPAFFVLDLDSEIPSDWRSAIKEVGFLDVYEMKSIFGDAVSYIMSRVFIKEDKAFFFFKEEEAKKMIPYVFSLSTVVDEMRKENPYLLLEQRASYQAKDRLAVPIYFDGIEGELKIHYENKTFFVKLENTIEKIEEEGTVLQATKRLLQKVEKANRLTYLYKKKPFHFSDNLFRYIHYFMIEPIATFLGEDSLEKECAAMNYRKEKFEPYELPSGILIFQNFGVYVKAYPKEGEVLIGRTIEELMQKEQIFMIEMFQKSKETKEEKEDIEMDVPANTTGNATSNRTDDLFSDPGFADLFSDL